MCHDCDDRPNFVYWPVRFSSLIQLSFRAWIGSLFAAHALEEGGALKARRKSVNGRERVYYAVTTKGKRRLEHLSDEWKRVSTGVNSALSGNGANGDPEHA